MSDHHRDQSRRNLLGGVIAGVSGAAAMNATANAAHQAASRQQTVSPPSGHSSSVIASRQDGEYLSFSEDLAGIRTAGYRTAGDGGGAFYRRVATEPSGPGKFRSADGSWWELRESVVTPQMLGAVGNGGSDPTDDHEALVRAIASTPTGGTLELNGIYRSTRPILLTRSMTIRGLDRRVGNWIGGDTSRSAIYFEDGTDGFVVRGCVVTFDGIIVTGTGVGANADGIRAEGENNSVRITGGSVIQSFGVGVRLVEGYYNKLTDISLVDCGTPLFADYVYNLDVSCVTIKTADGGDHTGVKLVNGSAMRMSGGSVENFTDAGFLLSGGSSLLLTGTYFEGHGGACIRLSGGCSATAIGCQAYLSVGTEFFIERAGDVTAPANVYSRNNRLHYPKDDRPVVVYNMNGLHANDWMDIAGDNWDADAGSGVQYLSTASAPKTHDRRWGQFTVVFPPTHPEAFQPISTIPLVGTPSTEDELRRSTEGTMAMFAADNRPGSDPLGIRNSHFPRQAVSPYWAVRRGNQWEKVGLRLPAIEDARSQAEAVTKFNDLLAALRQAGVLQV